MQDAINRILNGKEYERYRSNQQVKMLTTTITDDPKITKLRPTQYGKKVSMIDFVFF